MPQTLVRYSKTLEIVGDLIKVQVPESAHQKETGPRFGDLAVVESSDGSLSLGQVINLKENTISLQVFSGTKGVSTDSAVRFLGHPMEATYSDNILGRVFRVN